MAGFGADSTHGGRRSFLCQNFGLNCSLYHMIGRCVSQQLSQVIPSTPVCEKESWLPVSTQFFGPKFSVPNFWRHFPPHSHGGKLESGRFVSLNKIGLNFSTSTHICNYLISNMKHTLQNLCFGHYGRLGWWMGSRERLKKISGVDEDTTATHDRPCTI